MGQSTNTPRVTVPLELDQPTTHDGQMVRLVNDDHFGIMFQIIKDDQWRHITNREVYLFSGTRYPGTQQ